MVIPWSSFISNDQQVSFVSKIIKSGWISGGSSVIELENKLQDILEAKHCSVVSNGTAALQCALQAVDLQCGQKVIVPSFCFHAAANVIKILGGIPVFVDVDIDNFNVSIDQILASNEKDVVGIVLVHNYGISSNISEIIKWARSSSLWIIEDCAEAWFSQFNGRLLGNFGDIATFSMHTTKMVTSGEGGVVTTNKSSLKNKIEIYKNHGMIRSKGHYNHIIAGHNYRLSNILAGLALSQCNEKEAIISNYINIDNQYRHLLKNVSSISFQKGDNRSKFVPWKTAIKIDLKSFFANLDTIVFCLLFLNVEVRKGFRSVGKIKYFSDYKQNCKNADYLTKSVFSLPAYIGITNKQVGKIAKTIIYVLGVFSRNNKTNKKLFIRFRTTLQAFLKCKKKQESCDIFDVSKKGEYLNIKIKHEQSNRDQVIVEKILILINSLAYLKAAKKVEIECSKTAKIKFLGSHVNSNASSFKNIIKFRF